MSFRQKWIYPSGTKTYFAWRNMRSRCLNPKHVAYDNYGARGIKICDRWVNNYDAFVEDMGLVPEGLSLEREDTDGNYEPGNCVWATVTDQLNNQRRNRRISFEGRERTLSQWAREIGIPPDTLAKRLDRMPPEDALKSGALRPWRHGTRAGYEGHKCRCDLCRESNNVHHRERRKKRKVYDL